MRTLFWWTLLLTALGACSRWRPLEPKVLQLGNPDAAYQAVIQAAAEGGYKVVQQDPKTGLVVVESKVDAGDPDQTSWISLQVFSDGSVQATARGYHVKPGERVMHAKLDQDMTELMRIIEYNARVRPSAATAAPPGSAVAQPTGPPPPDTATAPATTASAPATATPAPAPAPSKAP